MTSHPVIVVEDKPFPPLLQGFLDRNVDPSFKFEQVIITLRVAAAQPRCNAFGGPAEVTAGLARTLGGQA